MLRSKGKIAITNFEGTTEQEEKSDLDLVGSNSKIIGS